MNRWVRKYRWGLNFVNLDIQWRLIHQSKEFLTLVTMSKFFSSYDVIMTSFSEVTISFLLNLLMTQAKFSKHRCSTHHSTSNCAWNSLSTTTTPFGAVLMVFFYRKGLNESFLQDKRPKNALFLKLNLKSIKNTWVIKILWVRTFRG